jgi:4-alpha-glucanotransferase
VTSVIQKVYVDALGNRHRVPPDTIRAIEKALTRVRGVTRAGGTTVVRHGSRRGVGPAEILLEDGSSIAVDNRLPADLPCGYHDILPRKGPQRRLIVAPASCWLPDDLETWGWAIQLYAARGRKSWGIGDLADLRWLGRWARGQRAGLALVNPLAAPSPTLPQQPSPYFPSSRRFRSPLYLRIEEVDGAGEIDAVRRLAERGRALNRDRRIDRDAVFRLKGEALDRIWRVVRRRRDDRFEQFRGRQPGLTQFATYCALAERFGASWRRWPDALRHPTSAAVVAAARDPKMRDRIRFHEWVQYQVDLQLARASAALPVMQDLPIGFDPSGADAWAFQDVIAPDISVGAPPDEFNTKGQNWGLPPFAPDPLDAAGYEPFVQTLRACLRHAGGLRIDHVMGLFRLFWIPDGMEPKDGAYVRGHAANLLGIVALESQRARAVIVGEDLGTVEEEVRRQLMALSLLSYRLIWFERVRPSKFPELALGAVTTHDLPTVAGLWTGRDLAEQKALGLDPNEAGTREILARVRRLTRATARTPAETVIARLHEALGRAPTRLLAATLDDALAVEERPNMPATSGVQRPNWSLALPRPIETLKDDRLARRIARALGR